MAGVNAHRSDLTYHLDKRKGVISSAAVAARGEFTCIIVRPMFIEKWVKDLNTYLGIPVKEINVIQGSASLKKLTKLASRNKIKSKVVIVSNKTYQNFIKDFETSPGTFKKEGWCATPFDFFEKLKVGVLLRDEIHLDFHLNYKIDTYTHVCDSFALSATLLNDTPFIERMQEIMFPPTYRYKGRPIDKYVTAWALMFNFSKPWEIRTTYQKGGFYSHLAFEEAVLKRPVVLENYMKMVVNILNNNYLPNTKANKKAIVFCATIEMCTKMAAYLKSKFPHLSVERYVGGDSYENMLTPDIRVTTPGSGSTGHDIPDLVTCIMTVAINSTQSNTQLRGRLRFLGKDVQHDFIYFVCQDVETHLKYHKAKLSDFKDPDRSIVKEVKTIYSGINV